MPWVGRGAVVGSRTLTLDVIAVIGDNGSNCTLFRSVLFGVKLNKIGFFLSERDKWNKLELFWEDWINEVEIRIVLKKSSEILDRGNNGETMSSCCCGCNKLLVLIKCDNKKTTFGNRGAT